MSSASSPTSSSTRRCRSTRRSSASRCPRCTRPRTSSASSTPSPKSIAARRFRTASRRSFRWPNRVSGTAVSDSPGRQQGRLGGVSRSPPGALPRRPGLRPAARRRGAARHRPARHPFWQHAERQAFLAERNGHVVGRIAAIIDRLTTSTTATGPASSASSNARMIPKRPARSSRRAAEWLAARGRDTIRGPVNPSLKGEFGVVVRGNDDPPAIMMAHTPARYGPLLEFDRPAKGPRLPRLRARQGRRYGPERELGHASRAQGPHPRPPSRTPHRPRDESRTSRRRSRTSTNSAIASARRCGASRRSPRPNSISSRIGSCA